MATGTSEVPAPGFSAEYADLIGLPFSWKGRGPDRYDCYGLVAELERRNGREVPDYESPTVMAEVHTLAVSSAQMWQACSLGPGAVVLLRCGLAMTHVGMVLPFGKLIHSWERSGGVCVERLESWTRRISGSYTYKKNVA